MGLMFVLIFWAIAGSVLALLGCGTFYVLSRVLLRKANPRPKLFLTAVTFFPIACLGWAGSVFVFQAVVNVTLLHRDPGLGDGWDCPLPDGYAISFVDVMNQATLYKLRDYPSFMDTPSGDGVLSGVRFLQLAGDDLLGASDSQSVADYSENSSSVDRYFALNTRTNALSVWSTRDGLNKWSADHHVRLQLEPIEAVYFRYRRTWFDWFAFLLLVLPPIAAAILLFRWGWNIRRDSLDPSSAEEPQLTIRMRRW